MIFSSDTTEAPTTALGIHPENERIYGTHDNIDDLLPLIKDNGIREAIVITKGGEVVSGGRRFRAALKLGLDRVPVTVFKSDDTVEIQSAIVEYNSHRVKNNRQIAAEAAVYMRIEKERAARRQATANAKAPPAKLPEHDTGTARDAVGKKLNLSGKSVEKAAKTAEASDALKAAGKVEEAAELDAAINKGFDRAFRLAVEKGHISPPPKRPSSHKQPAKSGKDDLELQRMDGSSGPCVSAFTGSYDSLIVSFDTDFGDEVLSLGSQLSSLLNQKGVMVVDVDQCELSDVLGIVATWGFDVCQVIAVLRDNEDYEENGDCDLLLVASPTGHNRAFGSNALAISTKRGKSLRDLAQEWLESEGSSAIHSTSLSKLIGDDAS